jgi:hypothetical protein
VSRGRQVTQQMIWDHVDRLGQEHPPIDLDTVDRHVVNPRAVRERYGDVIDYLSRVELEVDRNVLELLTLLPNVAEIDRHFFADVWQPQEIHHGLALDRLQQDIGMAPSNPDVTGILRSVRLLGTLAHLRPVQDIVRLLYFLTGAATERSAVLAYNRLTDGMVELGERAIAETIIAPIKRQEPGHFAYYRMSAMGMVQRGVLAPWQLRLAGFLRSKSFALVGVNNHEQRGDFGGLVVALGMEDDIEDYARDISRVERDLLWAAHQGMAVPPYVLNALRDALDQYRSRSTTGSTVLGTA